MKLSRVTTPHVGVELRSAYVERFWLPILGPTSTLFLRHTDELLGDLCDHPVTVDDEELAGWLGVAGGVMRRAAGRCVKFGVAFQLEEQHFGIPRRVMHVPKHQVLRLSTALQLLHAQALLNEARDRGVA